MIRITITLDDRAKVGLQRLAEKEFRDPRAQAALIIRKELEKRGLIASAESPALNACHADADTPTYNAE